MSDLSYGSKLCAGVPGKVRPQYPCSICRSCLRHTAAPMNAWQQYLEPPPAKHDGLTWVCDHRVAQ